MSATKALKNVPLIDLPAQVAPLKAAILKDWATAVSRAQFTHGTKGHALVARLAG